MLSECDFERLLQREGTRIQRLAENRGVHAQFGELLDIAQIVEFGNAAGRGDLRVGTGGHFAQQLDVRYYQRINIIKMVFQEFPDNCP